MMRMYSFNATARNYAVSSATTASRCGSVATSGGVNYLTNPPPPQQQQPPTFHQSSMKQFNTAYKTPSMMVYSQRFPNLRPLTFDRDGVVGSELHMAVLQRDVEAVVWLAQMGANPNDTTSNNESVLHLGVASGVVEIVSFLIRIGAHLNAADDEGDRPLHWAVREGCIPIAQCLLAECASGLLDIDAPNADGDTALHLSCSLGDADMTALLLEHGANPNLWNTSKFTALDEALANGHSTLVPLLQNYNARQGYSKQQSAFYPRFIGTTTAVPATVVCAEPFIGTHSGLIGAGAATAAAATTAAIAGLGGVSSTATGGVQLNSAALTCSGEHDRQQLVVKLQQLSVATNQV